VLLRVRHNTNNLKKLILVGTDYKSALSGLKNISRLEQKHLKHMEITEAFAILNISFESTTEEINKRYKELSQIHHPDKGGSDEEFSRLKDAKDLAIIYAENKSLVLVANHVYTTELVAIEEKREISNQVTSILNKTERKYRSKYQSLKDMSLILAFISGILGLITNKSLPIFEMIPENYRNYFLIIATFFAIAFLWATFKTNRLKDKIDELREIFENKEELYCILLTIFTSNNILTRSEIYREINLTSFDNKIHSKNLVDRTLLFYNMSNSLNSLIKLIGYEEFGKILILKGVSNKMLTEIENKNKSYLEIKYFLNK